MSPLAGLLRARINGGSAGTLPEVSVAHGRHRFRDGSQPKHHVEQLPETGGLLLCLRASVRQCAAALVLVLPVGRGEPFATALRLRWVWGA